MSLNTKAKIGNSQSAVFSSGVRGLDITCDEVRNIWTEKNNDGVTCDRVSGQDVFGMF